MLTRVETDKFRFLKNNYILENGNKKFCIIKKIAIKRIKFIKKELKLKKRD